MPPPSSRSFAGIGLPTGASWGDGDLAPKLLGCYEAELHPALEKAIARRPEIVVNVGCAEGYYAVGLARRLPEAVVHAFDISEPAQAVCAAAAEKNAVGERVRIGGRCDPATLVELAQGRRALILMDCEGGERELLDAATTAALAECDVLVECHDFMDRSITPNLTALLQARHEAEAIREGARDPSQYAILRQLNSLDRWLMVCEFRPEVMNWIAAWARR
jgi:hypothetical protein